MKTETKRLRKMIRALILHIERCECRHETTHRGGNIWTICDDCGAQWADDRGGFKPWTQLPLIADAKALLKRKDTNENR